MKNQNKLFTIVSLLTLLLFIVLLLRGFGRSDSPEAIKQYNQLKATLPALQAKVILACTKDERLHQLSAELKTYTSTIAEYTNEYRQAKQAGASTEQLQEMKARFHAYHKDNDVILENWITRVSILSEPFDSAFTSMSNIAPKTFEKEKQALYRDLVTPAVKRCLPELEDYSKECNKAYEVFGYPKK